MLRIKVPATSANLGPGFDTFGLALNLFNIFYVEKAEEVLLENVEEEFRNENNTFVVAYIKTLASCGKKAGIHVKFDTKIPISRGLGSSSSLVVAGVLAANSLHHLQLSVQEMLKICVEIEGHPDNVVPCLLGGFVTSLLDKNSIYTQKIDVHPKFHFSVFIPDFEVKTSEARRVLPEKISLQDSVFTLSRAVFLCFALQRGEEENLHVFFQDKIHEPHRKKLIPDYEDLQKEVMRKGALAFMISGSGSTCLAVSLEENFSKNLNLSGMKAKWRAMDCRLHSEGAEVIEIEFKNQKK